MNRFIIFANARTGSTSLAKLLGESIDVNMCPYEPFHENYSKWEPSGRNYSKFIKDEQTLELALDELFKKYNAFKCLDYQFGENIYTKLLSRKDIKILFLTRRASVLSAISALVAHQTKVWHKDEAEKAGYEIYDKLKPIPIEEIDKILNYVNYQNQFYENFLEKNRTRDFLRLYYEDLYSTDNLKNQKTIKRICEFLGVSVPAEKVIDKYMNPNSAHISAGGVYRKIPNIKEIEERFGKLY